jgi:ppGpp synthetase/RelA/SpoT-type nucleotidyltranferase
MRHELTGKVRGLKLIAITAARLKRMVSIRKKLTRSSTTFVQMQDLGGCRAIVDSIAGVEALIALYRSGGTQHRLREDTSYIERPRRGGYRSHHFVLDFSGAGPDAAYDGRRVEIQIRTQLQHAWATAVEAVGMVRGEDLKAGDGNVDWLRLFALMASVTV